MKFCHGVWLLSGLRIRHLHQHSSGKCSIIFDVLLFIRIILLWHNLYCSHNNIVLHNPSDFSTIYLVEPCIQQSFQLSSRECYYSLSNIIRLFVHFLIWSLLDQYSHTWKLCLFLPSIAYLQNRFSNTLSVSSFYIWHVLFIDIFFFGTLSAYIDSVVVCLQCHI